LLGTTKVHGDQALLGVFVGIIVTKITYNRKIDVMGPTPLFVASSKTYLGETKYDVISKKPKSMFGGKHVCGPYNAKFIHGTVYPWYSL
jgi:hypothetical protein